ncbi:DoxX family protein [Dyella dinghuensis]|uniref:DoxX family protein n=1 Tax=Dyella dinghuensis TaxID=1920169 RepID=A0A432LSP9_9GAMM|nr:DoxX family protein [Dyella dinghuensis]RUL63177.1 DoxX family protein [Dyella dinghuensis]
MERYKFLPLLGRVLLGLPFLMSGLGKLGAYAATVGYIASVGLPAPPLAFITSVVIEIGGSLLLLSGFRTRFASVVLGVFSIATAVFFHHNFADQNQMIHFLKDVMITGGLLQIAYFGAGAFSVDNRIAHTGTGKVSVSNA